MALTGADSLKLQHEAERADEIVIDPIEVIREPWLQDLIFQHLTGSDVKNLFTVSKTWNQAASESSKALSKIKLNIIEYESYSGIARESIRMLLNSNRRYQNAAFCFVRKTNFDRKILLLERFSPSLVDLNFSVGPRTAKFEFNSELHFPKLEKLDIETSSKQTIGVLQGATVLKELRFPDSSMLELMAVSSSLTTLEISRECSKEGFEYILTAFPSLKKFRVKEFSPSFLEIAKLNNQSITEFSYDYKPLPNNVISSMKNLEFMNCWCCEEPNLRKILTEGKRLKRVKINNWFEDTAPTEIYETLMASDPMILQNIVIVISDGIKRLAISTICKT
jgi:hypothetical protein